MPTGKDSHTGKTKWNKTIKQSWEKGFKINWIELKWNGQWQEDQSIY